MKEIVNHMLTRISRRLRSNFPNVHLPASEARIVKLHDKFSAFLRPSFSDYARYREYEKSLYVPEIVFTRQVKSLMPKAIIDVGANIGLSSLSLVKSFPSVMIVVGIEAERQNYLMLEKNYTLWSCKYLTEAFGKRMYYPVYAVAGAKSGEYESAEEISRLPGGISASGTFSFFGNMSENVESNLYAPGQSCIEHSNMMTSLSDVFGKYLKGISPVIVKVDIEGGEEYIFSGDASWLEKTALLTVEVHDRMGPVHSSRNLLEKLVQYDFAIFPSEDVLHCYNRKFFDRK